MLKFISKVTVRCVSKWRHGTCAREAQALAGGGARGEVQDQAPDYRARTHFERSRKAGYGQGPPSLNDFLMHAQRALCVGRHG